MTRLISTVAAFLAAVVAGALAALAGFSALFGWMGWDFLFFAALGILVLSLPIGVPCLVSRRRYPSTLARTLLVSVLNGLLASLLLVSAAAYFSPLVMLGAGVVGGLVFHAVEHLMAEYFSEGWDRGQGNPRR
ncbi:hypothetical protein [Aureimonas sp. ME7]|uniref:hypothetical protein n=1 Tax=Aureimonas sp. ME7 TaxID=2744252 RepID=UPI0015F6475B|nr:hypothetical protein [Aureimonas sp. ME7]